MLLFDLDGTLIDSNGVWEEIDLNFLKRRGLAPTEEYNQTVGHSIFPIAAQFTKDYYSLALSPQEIMDEWMTGAREAYANEVPLKQGSREFLEVCRRKGERLAVVTACVPELCRAALSRHGLEEFFEDVIFAQELGMEKRNPQVFLHTSQRLGVAPETCTLYEDAPANCVAAQSAGMRAVGVYDGFYARYEPEMRARCDGYIRSFLELL